MSATPTNALWKERVAAPRAWGNAVEKLRSRQIDLKERAAVAKICWLDEGGREGLQQTGSTVKPPMSPLRPPSA